MNITLSSNDRLDVHSSFLAECKLLERSYNKNTLTNLIYFLWIYLTNGVVLYVMRQ